MAKITDNDRIQEMIEAVMKVAHGDFNVQVALSNQNDDIDALAMGLNMMIEDLAENSNLQGQFERLKAINQEVESAKNRAMESDRLKSAFLANMSHEIRTPMNAILGFSILLEKPDLPPERLAEYVSIIRNSGNHLMRLINDILDLAKIESNQLRVFKQFVRPEEVFSQVFEMTRQSKFLLDRPRVAYHFEPERTDAEYILHTDVQRLQQVCINLVNNALKYTMDGWVVFGYRFENTGEHPILQVYVKDTGIGIPREYQERIFDRFTRVEEVKSQEGTGIGLSITKSLVELLGGTLSLDSEPGVGSSFYVSFPCTIGNAPNPSSVPFQSLEKEVDLSPYQIYVAEDSFESFRLMESILESFGGKPIQAANGKELLDLIEAKVPDLVFLDINMPVLNGFDALKIIRSRHYSFPVIVQSAYASPEERKRICAAGCDGYLPKPINPDSLIQEILLQLCSRNESPGGTDRQGR
ncbi:MAG: response regulator [Bacteroidales bacterium]